MFILRLIPMIVALFLISNSALLPRAFANEHGEEKKEEHGGGGHEEAKGHGESAEHAESGEGGGHEGGSHGEAKALAPWVEIENKITELDAKIKAKNSNIQHLIEEKNHIDNNSPALQSTVKEIVKEHREMRELVEQYDKNVAMLKYRFPERNAKAGRTYDRIEVKSVEDMEKAIGVDGKLNRNLRKMRSQFKSEDKSTVVQEEHKPAPPSKKAQSKEPSIEEAHAIILQK
jgi:hypothetical protein